MIVHSLPRIVRLAVLVVASIAAGSFVLSAAEREVGHILARARDFLGDEAALSAVRSLHFVGTVTSEDGRTRAIEIVARRPMQQLIIETTEAGRVTIGLDDYDGWRRVEPAAAPGQARVEQLGAADVQRLRANLWQNLYFYRALAVVGGEVLMRSDMVVDQLPCIQLTFLHPGGVVFRRCFETNTGRLLLTNTDDGTEVRERGSMEVAGVRFPKELTTTRGGKSDTITFDDVRVNEEFFDTNFALPRPSLPGIENPETGTPARPEEKRD